MADLVRSRTEIECIIADFKSAGSMNEKRRQEVAKELDALEKRIEEAGNKLVDLGAELDDRVAEERDAKNA
jgi:structural maintenance of chromosome 3 (chondroitin sulfate proteoglycan 6)